MPNPFQRTAPDTLKEVRQCVNRRSPLSRDGLMDACKVEWAKFLADSKLTEEQVTDTYRMVFQAAFTAGVGWHVDRVADQLKNVGSER
jgi:hypothetical protein